MLIATPLSVIYDYLREQGWVRETGDPTLDAVYYLAMLQGALQRMEKDGLETRLGREPLLSPALERAYRDVIHIRSRVNAEWLNDTVYSRYGRLYPE